MTKRLNSQQWTAVWLARALSILAVILVSLWMSYYAGGLGWDVKHVFNVHPVCMILAFAFITTHAVLAYRTLPLSKELSTLVHLILHYLSFGLIIVALMAVFKSHNEATPPIPNMYSLHSWIGLTVVVIYALNLIIGTYAFFYPKVNIRTRTSIIPIHAFIGIMLFILSVVTALLGIMDKMRLSYDYNGLDVFSAESKIANSLGFTLVGLLITVVYAMWPQKSDDGYLPVGGTDS